MSSVIPFKKKSLFFAPMEGITDSHYRENILRIYPEWDYLSTDFLRVPSAGEYTDKHIIAHFGENSYQSPNYKNKTIYQILTSDNALTEDVVQKINHLNFKWLDLNLGCPSKTVCKNKGGSFLLSELQTLRSIIKIIRDNFTGTFTSKIRVGYEDDSNFEKIIELLNEEKVDAITVHGRTRVELYKGFANWDYIKKAVSISSIPIIGNGDVWDTEDIENFFEYTSCHSIMLARSALKSPWLARSFKAGKKRETESERREFIKEYFNSFFETIMQQSLDEKFLEKRLKSISRYIFEDLKDEREVKRTFLLSHSIHEMMEIINSL